MSENVKSITITAGQAKAALKAAEAEGKGGRRYEAFTREDEPKVYDMLDELLRHHSDLAEAKIALAWIYKVKPNAEGNVMYGRAKKASDLDVELHGFDFVITLNYDIWAKVPEAMRLAMLDHELTHCMGDVDDAGENTWKIRKHDLEEFTDIVKRYGLWRDSVKEFVEAAQQGQLFEVDKPADQRSAAAGS